MATTSTNAILAQVRTQLLTYNTNALDALLTELYLDRPSDNAAFPYGIMRVVDNSDDPNYDFTRLVIQLEVMLHGNKASHAATIEDAGDACDKAMFGYSDSSSGMVFCRSRSRAPAPATSDPAFREAASVRLVYELVCYPLYLNTED